MIFCNLVEFVIIYISSQLQYLIKKGGIHMKQLNWATLGCGVIANELAQALSKEERTLYSVANKTHEKAQAFAQKYGISKVYDNIDDVFYDPDVDIIYISTPHNTHINYLRKALSVRNLLL